MIHFHSPYSLIKDIGKAYNESAKLVTDPNDWICFTDLDSMFLVPDIGHQLQEIIDQNLEAGLLTCVTNRIGNVHQKYDGKISDEPNILEHRKIALQLSREKRHQVKEIITPISGHLMLIKKATWDSIGGAPEGRGLLSVDNTISNRMTRHGYKTILMEGVYLFHFYRMDTHIKDRRHLA